MPADSKSRGNKLWRQLQRHQFENPIIKCISFSIYRAFSQNNDRRLQRLTASSEMHWYTFSKGGPSCTTQSPAETCKRLSLISENVIYVLYHNYSTQVCTPLYVVHSENSENWQPCPLIVWLSKTNEYGINNLLLEGITFSRINSFVLSSLFVAQNWKKRFSISTRPTTYWE